MTTTPMILDIKGKEICWFSWDYDLFSKHSFKVRGYSDHFLKVVLLLSDNEVHTLKDICDFLKVKKPYGYQLMHRIEKHLIKNFNFESTKRGYILYDKILISY